MERESELINHSFGLTVSPFPPDSHAPHQLNVEFAIT